MKQMWIDVDIYVKREKHGQKKWKDSLLFTKMTGTDSAQFLDFLRMN